MKNSVVILGVGPGLGFSLAKLFGKAGQKPILLARNKNKLTALQGKLLKVDVQAEIFPADVNDEASISHILTDVSKDGIPQTLIFNAADMRPRKPSELTLGTLQEVFGTNVFSAVAITQAYLKLEPSYEQPREILLTGGSLSDAPAQKASSLSMTKAALKSYAQVLMQRLENTQVAVNLMTVKAFMNKEKGTDPDVIGKQYLAAAKRHQSGELVGTGK